MSKKNQETLVPHPVRDEVHLTFRLCVEFYQNDLDYPLNLAAEQDSGFLRRKKKNPTCNSFPFRSLCFLEPSWPGDHSCPSLLTSGHTFSLQPASSVGYLLHTFQSAPLLAFRTSSVSEGREMPAFQEEVRADGV